jgi:chromosomal replication initiator protein
LISGLFSLPLLPLTEPQADAPRANTTSESNGQREHFFAGQENALVRALAAAMESAEVEYNPIVLCGASGVGKSALASALAARRKVALDLKNVIATTGDDFARSLAHAIDTDSVADLRTRHQRCDLLVIDELHRLAKKAPAQQFLLSILDALVRRGTLVLVTLRQLPQATPGLARGLASRLAGGLIVPLAPPGLLARRELVLQSASRHKLSLAGDVVDRLARGGSSPAALLTAPKLRHAVMQLAAAAEASHTSIHPAQVARQLDDEAPESKIIFRQVTAAVARHSQVPARELKGKSRQQTVADARGLAMYLARRLTRASYAEIGRHFGNRDHSTVLHACRKLDQLVARDDQTRRTVEELTTQIASGQPAG